MGLLGMLNQTLTIYAKSSYNDEGREVVGSGATVKARFQQTTKQKLLPNGSLKTIDAIAYVAGDITVETDAKVSYGGVNYKVFGKYAENDGQGNTQHIKLELVKWIAT